MRYSRYSIRGPKDHINILCLCGLLAPKYRHAFERGADSGSIEYALVLLTNGEQGLRKGSGVLSILAIWCVYLQLPNL